MSTIHSINEAVFESFPVMETERLVLRAYIVEDAADLHEVRADMHVWIHDAPGPVESLEDVENQIIQVGEKFADKQSVNWAMGLKSTNEMIGYIGFWRLLKEHCRGEIGYAMKKTHWCQGYMAEAFPPVLKFAFEQLNLHSIEANANPGNERSLKLLEGYGFQKEGYRREDYLFNGKFEDTICYGLLEKDLKI